MGWISWLCPGMNLKRWLLLFTVGVLCCALGLALFFNYQFMGANIPIRFPCWAAFYSCASAALS